MEEFLNLSNIEISKLVSESGNKTMLYSQNAIRKLLDHLLMIFEHGISTVIYPMWFYTLEMRGPEYVPKFIGYLQGLKSLLLEPLLLQAYMKAGIRIIFYGEFRELLMRENDTKLIEVFERIMEITKNNTKKVVLFGTNIQDPSTLIIDKSINFFKKNNREPTKSELIKEYYGVEVEEVSFYFGFDRFSTDGRPILLCDKGNEDLYFSVSPHSFFTQKQLRKVLFDHLFCRSVANAKEYQLKVIDVEIMKTFYTMNTGNTMGVGEVQPYGQYWCPLPEVRRVNTISGSSSFSEINLVSSSSSILTCRSSPSSPSLISSPPRSRKNSGGSANLFRANQTKFNVFSQMDNQKHIFVNLSHLLLSEIFNKFEDIEDRIRFSLTCKRWYNEREHYFRFNVDSIKGPVDDQSLTLNKIEDIIIHKSVNKIEFWWFDDNIIAMDEPFIEKLAHSNVNNLVLNSNVVTTFKRLPNNIKHIHCNHSFDMNHLPTELETLEVSSHHSKEHHFYITALPKTLKYFELSRTIPPIVIKPLPPKLEMFVFYDNAYTHLDIPLIPSTLHTLEVSFGFWKNLLLNYSDVDELRSIEYIRLYIESDVHLTKSLIPISIKHLILEFDDDEDVDLTFEKDLFSQFNRLESLKFKGYFRRLKFGLLPPSLKILEPPRADGFSYPDNDRFFISNVHKLDKLDQIVPKHCKHLSFNSRIRILLLPGMIPNYIETIEFEEYCQVKLQADSIPPNITTITIRPTITLPSSLPTTIRTIYFDDTITHIQFSRLDDHYFILIKKQTNLIKLV
ncbi:hypothetical protein PPL_07989 [Heterostelium album PN500]|uniref:F-box domain-containing protein n=1 Tax=Heterostelium pallidum (strain ATCC 26659 / Pp 5 / PN500) TaxID=670386 RepID=D3BHI7_HETP5|nr:hypothetical protein PPL_07989 [Heterostelium album PN500]EFA79164.1 hypothetical protein PPL_07989 [Heterostelium album PN500]|eukprot:XP_020431285.1 hypothetical protein PPL_07989 [Heterostelium album PN500]